MGVLFLWIKRRANAQITARTQGRVLMRRDAITAWIDGGIIVRDDVCVQDAAQR